MVRETRTIDGQKYIVEHISCVQGDMVMKVYDEHGSILFSINGDFDTEIENELVREFCK